MRNTKRFKEEKAMFMEVNEKLILASREKDFEIKNLKSNIENLSKKI